MKKPAALIASKPVRKAAAKPRRSVPARAKAGFLPPPLPRSVALELLLTPGCDCALCGHRNPWRD